MPTPALLWTLLRENLGTRTLPREPEPDLVMDGPEQVAAYAQAGRADGAMSATYLFNAARITQLIRGCERVVDLGCGPATQLAQVAALNPAIRFRGVDLSGEMLESGRRHLRALGLENVELVRDDISRLDAIESASADAVTSTMALHHLPSLAHLRDTFRQVRRILKPGGRLYLLDLGRLKSLASIVSFAYADRDHEPHIFLLDFERSLRAAFLPKELRALAAEELPADAKVFTTFRLPLLVLVTTPAAPLTDRALADRLRSMRSALPRRHRRQLDDIRLFFRLGGLEHDPFA